MAISVWLVALAFISIVVSVGSVGFVVYILRTSRRQQEELRAQIVDPVVLEAAKVQKTINGLLEQLRVLSSVVGEGRKASEVERLALEARIKQLQADLVRVAGKEATNNTQPPIK